jgi:protein gp37
MSDKTKIEWTDASWNPIRGCSRVSEGCRNCYAEVVASRFSGLDKDRKKMPYFDLAQRVAKPDGTTEARWTGKVVYAGDNVLMQPLKWKKPRRIFVNSMSDLFHDGVTDEVRDKVFAVMNFCWQHTFQLLTKRPENMLKYINNPDLGMRVAVRSSQMSVDIDNGKTLKKLRELEENNGRSWPMQNLHLGVSVENQATANERIPLLLQTRAAVRFVSAEPLLGAIEFTDIDTNGEACMNALEPFTWQYIFDNHWKNTAEKHSIYSDMDQMVNFLDLPSPPDMNALVNPTLDWIIVGGESGKNARPMHPDWVRSIRDQCEQANVPFFFKQWGEHFPRNQWKYSPDLILPNDEYVASFTAPCVSRFGSTIMHRVGKKLAGRLLDGVEHNAMPEVKSHATS